MSGDLPAPIMKEFGKARCLIATARVANIPSVVSNVWAGVAVTILAGGAQNQVPWTPSLRLAIAGVLLYVSGNFLNDWMDRAWDRQHRPERALPRGLFPPGLYLALSSGLGLLGLWFAASVSLPAGIAAAAILGAIAAYTFWHKRSPWAVIAMGLCRALLPVMGAMGTSGESAIGLYLAAAVGAGLFFHIAGLSLSARYESLAHPPAVIYQISRLLFATAAGVAGVAVWQNFSGPWHILLAGLLPYLLWIMLCLTVWRKPVPAHVSRLLAGIPLVDWMVLLPLALLQAGVISPLSAVCLAGPPLAFILALILQRVAPAT